MGRGAARPISLMKRLAISLAVPYLVEAGLIPAPMRVARAFLDEYVRIAVPGFYSLDSFDPRDANEK